MSNIPDSIKHKLERKLHLQQYHPIEIIKKRIYDYFGPEYKKFDDLSHYVNVEDNFTKLLIAQDHPARSKSDTYYLDDQTVLRTHTSAHQNELLSKGETKFLVTGDVYRKDEIDRHHYPIFHQMEGLSIVPDDVDPSDELKKVLSGLIEELFPNHKYRIVDDYFPFTHPSYQIDLEYNGKWIEVLGSGVVRPEIMTNCGAPGKRAWAFGLGLERLAMKLFGIDDIRQFWSEDPEFLNQFKSYSIVKFQPYSKLKPVTRDVSLWINPKEINPQTKKWIKENDFYEICREAGGDMIESVSLFDSFLHPKKQCYSLGYHFTYSPPSKISNPGEFDALVTELDRRLCETLTMNLGITIRSKSDTTNK